MNTNEFAELIFLTESGDRRAIRVPNPPANLSPANTNSAATFFINANPFEESIGPLVSLVRADRVVVNQTILLPEPEVA